MMHLLINEKDKIGVASKLLYMAIGGYRTFCSGSNVKPISRNVSKGAAFDFRAVLDGLHDNTNGDTPPAKDRAAAAVNATPNP
ncbi:hypothetical protein Tco_0885396, partial [Tanacetum coccineum]